MYAKEAARLGQPSLAITDHGSLAGALYHIEACEEVGIKPIVGMEAYFRPDIQADRERIVQTKKGPQKGDRYGYKHLVLLAKNLEGFKNLMRLSSLSYTEPYFYQKPNIDWEALRKHSTGLIASSSCVSGQLPEYILNGDTEEAMKYLRVMQDIFGDDFYLEIQPHDFDNQKTVNEYLIQMAEATGIPLVAASDAHYPFKDWADTQDVLIVMNTGKTIKTRDKALEEGESAMGGYKTNWLFSEDEIKELFADQGVVVSSIIDEAVKNSGVIADRCEHYAIDKSPKIPKATKSLLEAERILREWCLEGLIRIGKTDDQVYLARLEEEFDVMRKLKVFDYFVIVGDMVRWAKDQGIRVGPGRGSAAGSLINYLIRITAVDPIGYDLLFERFLNEYRTELPDIDIDFDPARRDEVLDYLKKKWGDDHVVSIAAFQSFSFKSAIKDVWRVLDLPFDEAHRVTELFPDAAKLFGEDFDSLRKSIPELDDLFVRRPEAAKHSYRLFGQMKGQSKHAAAVIVTDEPAIDLIPMMRAKDGSTVTQWSERANGQLISPYGFLKIDMLGVDGLTNQDMCIRLIEERHGTKIDFEDPKQFPVVESPYKVEEEVVKAFASGANLGVFQFGSRGIIGLLREIQPENLEHIIAANALFRPGTLSNGVAYDYARRKNGLQHWKLPHESMGTFVNTSYGFMIYQEQVMQIFRILGKDVESAASAVFLKVVAKGIARDLEGKQKLQKYYEQFAAGCEEKSIPKSAYDQVWSQILSMTTYAFNKSHSTGYALQAYQDMWLKKHYPLEFYTSLLTNETDKVPAIIRESKLWGIRVLPPDINISNTGFTIDTNAIRFGLLAIKYVADAAIKEIYEFRPFDTYESFYSSVPKAKVNKRVKSYLFKAGAFDSLGGRDSFVLDNEAMAIPGTMNEKEKAAGEKEAIGFTVSRKSDVEEFKELIAGRVWTGEELRSLDNEADVIVGGEILNVKEYGAKNGTMAFIDIEFNGDEHSCTFFTEKYSEYQHFLVEGSAILVSGTWDPERKSIVVSNSCTVAQLAKDLEKR